MNVENGARKMSQYSEFEFRKQPWFDAAWFDRSNFQGFSRFIPMKTIVVHCFDPRASEIPQAVADYFGDEVYPGENILDEAGNRIGNTRTLFAVSNAGGRALSALQSVATMDYLFKVQNVVVVHHSFCGATAFEPEDLVDEFHHHHHADISTLFDHDSLAISNFEDSIKHDVRLLRDSAAVPANVKLYGFFYEINSGKLTEVVRDIPA
ncbi:MAG: carbonic anhydrase [Paraburkholderia tropica]